MPVPDDVDDQPAEPAVYGYRPAVDLHRHVVVEAQLVVEIDDDLHHVDHDGYRDDQLAIALGWGDSECS